MTSQISWLVSILLFCQVITPNFLAHAEHKSNLSQANNTVAGLLQSSNNVERVGVYDTVGIAGSLFLKDTTLYVVDNADWDGSKYINGGLRVFDTTDPLSLKQTGSYSVDYYPYDFWTDGNVGYMADVGKTRIVSFQPPSTLQEKGTILTPSGAAFSVSGLGSYVYVGYGNGFQTINMSDPNHPSSSGNNTPWMISEMDLQDNYAYLAAWNGGLVVMSLSNPSQPKQVGRYQVPSSATSDISVEGNYAYVSGYDAGLYIVDISDPANPHDVGHLSFNSYAVSVDVHDGIAYVGTSQNGLRIVNCKDPSHPVEVGYFETGERVSDVVWAGNFIYASLGSTGLSVFRYTAQFSPLMMQGPVSGYISQNYSFTANLLLDLVSGNFTYTWVASDQQTVVHTATTFDSVDYTWNTDGKKTITLTVRNASNEVIATRSVEIDIKDIIIFTVNHSADEVDLMVSDGVCKTANNTCTLRAAIQEANAFPDLNIILVPEGTYRLEIAGTQEDISLTGDLDINQSLILDGETRQKTIIDGNGLDRVFHLLQGEITLKDVTVQNAKLVEQNDGGILVNYGSANQLKILLENMQILNNKGAGVKHSGAPLTIKNSLIANNQMGGIYSEGSIASIDEPALVIDHSNISNNSVSSSGAGVSAGCLSMLIRDSIFEGNKAATDHAGGAIVQYCSQGKLRITGSTIANNVAGDGAAISTSGEQAEIINSTISNNVGGAILATNASLQNVTVVMNAGSTRPALNGKFTLSHTLVAFNGPTNCKDSSTITTQGYNMSSDFSCNLYQVTDKQGVDPQLQPLTDNGGPTFTYALNSNSPAIDAGSSTCASTDQRGVKRPFDGNKDGKAFCDIGAFEYFTVSFSIDEPTVTEGSKPGVIIEATFSISISPTPVFATTLRYETADGSAKAGEDYEAVSGNIVFLPGESLKTVKVPVYDDDIVEEEEIFYLRLTHPAFSNEQEVQSVCKIIHSYSMFIPVTQK